MFGSKHRVDRLLEHGREVHLERLQGDPASSSRRPDLVAGGGREEVEHLVRERSAVYRDCADLVVSTDQRTPDQVAGEIVTWFGCRDPGGEGE